MADQEKSSLVIYAADERTTVANQAVVEGYMYQWGSDLGYFCGHVVGLLACSLETEDFQFLLNKADEMAKAYIPMLLTARNAHKSELVQ